MLEGRTLSPETYNKLLNRIVGDETPQNVNDTSEQ